MNMEERCAKLVKIMKKIYTRTDDNYIFGTVFIAEKKNLTEELINFIESNNITDTDRIDHWLFSESH